MKGWGLRARSRAREVNTPTNHHTKHTHHQPRTNQPHTQEAAGEVVEVDGRSYKAFYGMSSATAMNKCVRAGVHYSGIDGGQAKHRAHAQPPPHFTTTTTTQPTGTPAASRSTDPPRARPCWCPTAGPWRPRSRTFWAASAPRAPMSGRARCVEWWVGVLLGGEGKGGLGRLSIDV